MMPKTVKIVSVLCGLLLISSTARGQSLEVGFAESDITPPSGFPMAGYYHERLAEGIHDPLKAKAVVFRQGDRAAAFVVADLTGIARDLCQEVRRRASEKSGIPEANIVVSATHSHTAPDYTKQLYQYLAQSPADQQADSFPARLMENMADAIVRAHAAARPVVISAGAGRQQVPVAFNRRFVMKDGSVRTWQRLSNPEVIRAAGPIDPDIGLLQVHSADGERVLGVISNFALHLDTVGGKQWSADFPYYIEQSLKTALGDQTISVFGIGTCGDINHSDPTRPERNKTDFIGLALADTIKTTLPQLKPINSPRLQVRSSIVRLPLQDVTAHELDRAEELIPIAKAGGKVDFFDLVSAYKAVVLDQLQHDPPRKSCEELVSWGLSHAWQGVGQSLPVEVTAMTLSDQVAIVFLPGEVFVDLGLAIKRNSPFKTTLVIELSNCVETMYIPTRAAYAGGSYEVTNSAVQPGSGEMLVEAALKLLRESAASSEIEAALPRRNSVVAQRH